MALRIVSAILFSPRGGSAHVARALTRGLQAAGEEVTLVSGSLSAGGEEGDARAFYGPGVRAVDFCPALACGDPLGFEGPAGTAPMHPSFEDRRGAPDAVFARLDDLAFERQVRAWSRELELAGARRADVLHLHHLTPLNEAAARVAGQVPVVGQLHGTELLMLEQIAAGAPPGWAYAERWAERLRAWAGRCAYLVVAPAGVERARVLLGLAPERLVPLPGGVDSERFAPRAVDRAAVWRRALVDRPRGWLPDQGAGSVRYSPAEAERLAAGIVLAYVGRFTAVKRLDRLIGAFAQARRRLHRPAGLVLIGGHAGEWEDEHPADLIRRLGAEDVYLAGWHSHDELPQLLAAADVAVLASDQEQFGLGLVEAMACGLPAVTTDSPGPASIVEDGETGWLVAREEQALAEAIVEAVEREEERARRGRRARAVVRERYTWPAVSARLGEVLAQAASAGSPTPISFSRRASAE
jgi:glycosyltransferase involved in cell wall biosynthesis